MLMEKDLSIKRDLTTEEAHKMMMQILKEVHKICEKNNIKYQLFSGSLIGAMRNHKIIPWDYDIDISMLREEFNKFIKIAEDELPDFLFLQTFKTDSFYDIEGVPCKIRYNGTLYFKDETYNLRNPKMHNGIFIDIFPLDYLPLKENEYEYQKEIGKTILHSSLPEKNKRQIYDTLIKLNSKDSPYITYGIDTYWHGTYIFNSEDFKERELYEFEGEEVYISKKSDSILRSQYGDDYMIPVKTNEKCWHAKIL